ncbi:hypothetical protein [Benzoatithermus flavus]|uniref:Uncharacterized protein n=1 Tax=Benzoatithermus flavus TaxID=3108223 RepID=A0ABU8XRB5_9PROT
MRAAPVTLAGITFSDELGGVVLRGGSGRGTPSDPFVLYEDITDDGPAILVVRGLADRIGGPLQGPGQMGFSLRKIVTNRTARVWYSFELELREDLARPSTYEDGLSFGQATAASRHFTADRFRTVQMEDEPLDAVVFTDGAVRPGETVTVSLSLTDYTPVNLFYLLQRRESPSAGLGSTPSGG